MCVCVYIYIYHTQRRINSMRQAGAGELVLGAAHPDLHLLMSSRELLLETEVGMETNDEMPWNVSGIND